MDSWPCAVQRSHDFSHWHVVLLQPSSALNGGDDALGLHVLLHYNRRNSPSRAKGLKKSFNKWDVGRCVLAVLVVIWEHSNESSLFIFDSLGEKPPENDTEHDDSDWVFEGNLSANGEDEEAEITRVAHVFVDAVGDEFVPFPFFVLDLVGEGLARCQDCGEADEEAHEDTENTKPK